MSWLEDRDEHEELRLLRRALEVLERIERNTAPKLTELKISIGGIMPVGPVTINVGDSKKATVLGFDQTGAAFPIDFTVNPVSWSLDNATAIQEHQSPSEDDLLATAPGTANLSATCAGFTATDTITVIVPVPVLSSIKVSID